MIKLAESAGRVPGELEAPAAKNVSPGKHFAKSPEKLRKNAKLDTIPVPAPQPTFDGRALIHSIVAGLSHAPTRGFMTDETIDHLRQTCPGWDLHALHAEFERWVNADTARPGSQAALLHRMGQAPP